MIPLKLQLHNFLSYGQQQTIDFSSYRMICLSGKNGHGKSALLDAITWAIWGQARKITGSSKADQGLLRLGQTQMMVSLDFEFNGQHYRIRREFAQTYGKPYAALDFGLCHEEQFISLTDKTISATQAKIEETLNLSYDSFINSAFLRQGQSNEFSKKPPKERKEILATILGLNHLEKVRKLAMDKAREAQQQKLSRHTIQEKIEQELQKTPLINEQLAKAKKALEDNKTQQAALNTQQQNLLAQQTALTEKEQQLRIRLVHYESLCTQEKKLQQQLRTLVTQWRLIIKKNRLLPSLSIIEQEKQRLETALKEYQAILQKSLELKEAILQEKEQLFILSKKLQEQATISITQKKISLERLLLEKSTLATHTTALEKQQNELCTEQKQIEHELATLKEALARTKKGYEQHAMVAKQFEKRKEFYQRLLEQGKMTLAEIENTDKKLEISHAQDPSCPLCEQSLSVSRKRFLKGKFSDHKAVLQRRLNRITITVKKLKTLLLEQHRQLEQLTQQREQAVTLLARQEELKKRAEKLTITLQEISTLQETNHTKTALLIKNLKEEQSALQRLEQTQQEALLNHKEYQQQTVRIQEQEKALQQLAYNQPKHQQLTRALEQLEQQQRELQQLMQEMAQQEQRLTDIKSLIASLKQSKEQKALFAQDPVIAQQLKQEKAELEQQVKMVASRAHALNQQREQIIQEKAALDTQQTTLGQLTEEAKENSSFIAALSTTIDDYQTIATATSKDGIQALMIEQAIPEIEQEANYLLARLSHNQAQILIESLRDLKKGGAKETLDIKIADSAGIRSYELFSGGEAFRIDFALRIAISKLLARRAGTSLQTLIIDEGFGSQDEDGLSLIMDALYKIQEDFSKIIIVSHLTSMKDQFPIHFVIEKGPQGSMINVLEQG